MQITVKFKQTAEDTKSKSIKLSSDQFHELSDTQQIMVDIRQLVLKNVDKTIPDYADKLVIDDLEASANKIRLHFVDMRQYMLKDEDLADNSNYC
jgi:hypothetical protein